MGGGVCIGRAVDDTGIMELVESRIRKRWSLYGKEGIKSEWKYCTVEMRSSKKTVQEGRCGITSLY